MNFATAGFLLFYALVFACYWLLRSYRLKKLLLLAASYYFYMSWNCKLIVLILASTVLDYCIGLMLEKSSDAKRRKILLILSCCGNLGLLGLFKYAGFFADSLVVLANSLGIGLSAVEINLILPVGISFYTFQTMSYTIDVYRGRMKSCHSALDFALFVAFFPQLVAGPIVRAETFLPQLDKKPLWDWQKFRSGGSLVLRGLAKKIVIADRVAIVADSVFNQPSDYGFSATWFGVIAFAVQIYCDFSGYSDVAIGVARMLGFELCKNFDHPYLADSPDNFWHRWHISLSSWLRDYLYIPLGGNRGSKFRTNANLMKTMLLGGLWHGAAWTFVLWGFYQGAILVLSRCLGWITSREIVPEKQKISSFIPRMAAMWLLVLLGWVIFRAQSMADIVLIVKHMLYIDLPLNSAALRQGNWLLILLVVITHGLAFWRRRNDLEQKTSLFLQTVINTGCVIGILSFSRAESTAFIYFQF